MKVKTVRFGKIEVDDKDVLHFSKGLLAFDELTKYALLEVSKKPFFKWLQSLENPEITFLLVDPFLVKKDYSVDINSSLQNELQIEKEEDVLVYTTVTVPQSGFKDATTNLVGPLIINLKKNLAKQIVLEQAGLAVKYPLFPKNMFDNSVNEASGS